MEKIYFSVNGEPYSLSGTEVSADTSLNDYLRFHLNLLGTKAMCHEGGCGACIVSVSQIHPVSKEKRIFAVNSCLVNILSCHEWDITTVEGIGNRRNGYHLIQSRLAEFNGTQCGYCTPGWVMNMYSIYENSGRKLTRRQIENSFAGNMCRCTGYRPILDGLKSLALDKDASLSQQLMDVEDLDNISCVKKNMVHSTDNDDDWCFIENRKDSLLSIHGKDGRWYKATTINDIFQVLFREGSDDYRLVAGNTGQGVYPVQKIPRIQIDISAVEALHEVVKDMNLIIGAGVPLSDVMNIFQNYAFKYEEFKYLNILYDHLDLVAHIPVRNVGTIGGNLALKNAHHDFQSDIFVMLETVGATITLVSANSSTTELSLKNFLTADLKNKLILNVKMPPLSSNCKVRSYKVMRRAQNAHAVVNTGFLFKLDNTNKVTQCSIVLGGISPKFVRATNTENSIVSQDLFSNKTLQKALLTLNDEVLPVDLPTEPSPLCRKTIALGLFYKAVLSICPSTNPRYKSGGSVLQREVSRGTQVYDTDKTLWPVNQPVIKLEALAQCSGEARYVCDINPTPRDVHVAFVLSTICLGEIAGFDPSEALNLKGVISFITAKDIPGRNSFLSTDVPYIAEDEEILASRKISYNGQPIALIVAKTHKLAVQAAKLVKVTYVTSKVKPLLNIQDVLAAANNKERIREDFKKAASDKGTDTKHIIKGTYSMGSQYHYTMETQSCTVSPTENGYSVRPATQWVDLVQVAIAKSLGIPENKVDVIVPRVGGGYGGKCSRSSLVACACALVAHLLNRTATLVMPLTDNMAAIGKRQAFFATYELGTNDEGLIQYADLNCYSECGISFNDTSTDEAGQIISNLYDVSRWNITTSSVITDKHSNTWCRAPGTTEGSALTEHIMERIAFVTKKDPVLIRSLNLSDKHVVLRDIMDTIKKDSEYENRKTNIAKFNSENAWRKRALRLAIMSYPIAYAGTFPVLLTIYHVDATIVIAHGGVELGQGINTKIAQVCAHTLNVPLSSVSVRPCENFTVPNAMVTSGSITSECAALSTINACKEILKRLEPVKAAMNEPTWEEVVKKAFEKGINLQVSGTVYVDDQDPRYDVYGACVAEVELDVLTGTHLLLRVDLLEDTGISINPDIDIGQIEGAFIMGLGLHTSEELIFDSSTGRLLTDRTWTYKPPGVKDIPVDFRVSFKRNAVNPAGVLRSKATGEPALVLAIVVTFALHEAILEARKEFGYKDIEWIPLNAPATVENILKALAPNIRSFKIS